MSKKKPKKVGELEITCTSTDCERELHCFLQATRRAQPNGPCRECGADLIDWNRVHTRDLTDVDHTFEALRHECIRHHFWHLEFSQHAVNYARRAGYKELGERIGKRILSAVGSAQCCEQLEVQLAGRSDGRIEQTAARRAGGILFPAAGRDLPPPGFLRLLWV